MLVVVELRLSILVVVLLIEEAVDDLMDDKNELGEENISGDEEK
jgi:hypothetical protein